MSKIFELFGYPLEMWTEEAKLNCQNAHCPFMDSECDGGGNRYLSGINLEIRKDLQCYFPNKSVVQSGICSLKPKPEEQPWIVCPRRLFSLKSGAAHHQDVVLAKLIQTANLPKNSVFHAWSEVKIKVSSANEAEETKSFDYTFDYVLSGLTPKPISHIATLIDKSEAVTQNIAQSNGYTLTQRNGVMWVDDFPADPIVIVEIMTSSTSGGDKKKRTQIAMAFEDAIKNGNQHNGPGINYRQVWARMVSQLIVKSQVSIAWGGKTIWLLQDVLIDYISQSTALNFEKYLNQPANEVNILAFGYGTKASAMKDKIITLTDAKFYAGPISNTQEHDSGFIDIVKVGTLPPKEKLWKSLFLKKPTTMLKT